MRCGLIARKMGMTRFFTDEGQHVPVTVLQVEDCQVVAVRNEEKNGYAAVQLGAGPAKVKNVSKAERGRFAKAKVTPKQRLAEFRVSPDATVDVGDELSVNHFVAGQFVDVTGNSIGKGFAGAMKRHGFSGLRASHGVSVSHRAHGSTGQCQFPGRVFKGKKMAGHMGDRRVTTQNLEIVSTDEAAGLILVKGAVPGSEGGWVLVRDAVKKPLPEAAPFPAGLKTKGGGEAAEAAASEDTGDAEAAALESDTPAAETPAAEAPAAPEAEAGGKDDEK